jgi:glyoxylase-like metal-dependent hydrolase (beta-lactamase superfamily II)
MTRLRLRTLALPLGFAALLTFGLAFGRGRPQDPEVEAVSVAGTVHLLRGGRGGNIALCVGEDGVFMVDAQFADVVEANRAAILELAGEEPRWLVNTHWHRDHTGGNDGFAGTATITAHRNVRRRLAGDEEIGGRVEEEVREAALPDMTFENGVGFHLNGEDIQLLHYANAHTDGDSVVWFVGSNVVHMGDIYFQVGYPFIDVDSGGSVQGIIAAVKSVLLMVPEDVKVLCGHGEPSDTAGLREYLEMLETVTARVREGLEAGESAEELAAGGVTDGFDERWGGFDFVPPARFVESVARSLAGE